MISETNEERIKRLKFSSAVISNLIDELLEKGKSPDEIKMMFYRMVDVINGKKEDGQ